MVLGPGGLSENGGNHRGIDFFDRHGDLHTGRAMACGVRLGDQDEVPEGDPHGPRGRGRFGGDFFRRPPDFFLSHPLIPFFILAHATSLLRVR